VAGGKETGGGRFYYVTRDKGGLTVSSLFWSIIVLVAIAVGSAVQRQRFDIQRVGLSTAPLHHCRCLCFTTLVRRLCVLSIFLRGSVSFRMRSMTFRARKTVSLSSS